MGWCALAQGPFYVANVEWILLAGLYIEYAPLRKGSFNFGCAPNWAAEVVWGSPVPSVRTAKNIRICAAAPSNQTWSISPIL